MDWGNWLAKDHDTGVLVFEGTDVPLSDVRVLWASGHSIRDVVKHHPSITLDRAESAFHMFKANTFE